ncbi:OmpA family protein [Lacibacterium aquatile]|uniref:OmpA family protein n=1 Tax=Lacibacterium aquatile TaxID=1168082 RepID=A0ABW5DLI3_9PROT
MKTTKLLGALAGLALLSGCGALDVQELRGTTAPAAGTPFTKALSQEYRSVTLFEADKMNDWIDAYTFAAKGLAAARGENVLPETTDRWNLPAAKKTELDGARADLLKALDGSSRTSKPAVAAKAQVAFDCWVEQEEEGWQLNDIAACKGIFKNAMAELTGPVAQPGPAPVTAPIAAKNYIIYFAWDSARMDAAGMRVVDEAAAEAKTTGTSRLTIVGHADRSGTPEYNTRLSLRRADAVRAALAAKGIASERLSVTALGETEPAVPTADGVREARNRRVELTIR